MSPATTKLKKFWSRRAALVAVAECQDAGWPCGILGQVAPFIVQSISTGNGYRIVRDLHDDGKFHEFSRKPSVPSP